MLGMLAMLQTLLWQACFASSADIPCLQVTSDHAYIVQVLIALVQSVGQNPIASKGVTGNEAMY